jgi:hypothetical protein
MLCFVDPDPVGSTSSCRSRSNSTKCRPKLYVCPEQFTILSKVLQIMTPEPLTRKVNIVDWHFYKNVVLGLSRSGPHSQNSGSGSA